MNLCDDCLMNGLVCETLQALIKSKACPIMLGLWTGDWTKTTRAAGRQIGGDPAGLHDQTVDIDAGVLRHKSGYSIN
ncbi:hypothetical protein ES703_81121 [subsurface metagenome]